MNRDSFPLLTLLLVLAVMLTAGLLYLSILTFPQIPDDLNDIALNNPTYVLGDEDQIVKVLADRQVIPLEKMPRSITQAFIALEDVRFYRHHGLNKRALLRAVLANTFHRGIRQGGSTITQQLAKNLFFSFERDWARKFKEMFVAFQIERQFSKEQILEAYINQINFGSGVYGIELAAQTYFAKHAGDLSLAEAAMLAGIPRWPARYNPSINAGVARERQAFVLKRMVEEGFISETERSSALTEEIKVDRINRLQGLADYYIEEIKNSAARIVGIEAVNFGGLRIHTALNTRLQYEATRAVIDGLAIMDESMGLAPYRQATWEQKAAYPQAVLVAVDISSGAVKAMVGGRDFRRAPFNRATAANRHAGSAFKPFIYYTALERGLITPATVLVDEPVEFQAGTQSWAPDNIDFKYLGPVTAKYALMRSINTISAKLIYQVTPEAVVASAQRLGISSEMAPNLSLALGATGVSPLEMATAFATIANGGMRCQSYWIRQIRNVADEIIEETIPKRQQAANPQSCYLLLDMLQGVVASGGTGAAVRSYGFYAPCAGKTGTSNDYRDVWFVGFTPQLAVAVWVGFDDNRTMRDRSGRGITGSRAALPIWAAFMRNSAPASGSGTFTFPESITFSSVDPRTGAGPMPGGPVLEVALPRE